MSLDLLVVPLIGAYFVAWFIGFVWGLAYRSELRSRYPALHASLAPDPFPFGQRIGWRLFMFLIAARYRGIVDPDFEKQSNSLRLYLIGFLGLMGSIVLVLSVA